MALRASERLVYDLHDEVVVAPAEGAAHAGQARVAGKVGGRIDLEDVRLAVLAQPHIDAAVAFAVGHLLPGRAGYLRDPLMQVRLQVGRTDRDGALILRAPRDPFGRVAHDRPGSLGQVVE